LTENARPENDGPIKLQDYFVFNVTAKFLKVKSHRLTVHMTELKLELVKDFNHVTQNSVISY